MKQSLLLSAFFLFAFAACKKGTDNTPAEETLSFTLRNNVPSRIHLSVYNSRGDYYTDHNAIASTDVDAGAAYTLDGLTKGKEYYLDWYSPDYSYNNWYSGDQYYTMLASAFTPSDASTSFNLNHPGGVDFSRLIFLNGNGIASNWTAVAVYDSAGNNILNSLAPDLRVKQFTFRKDFRGIFLSYVNSALTTQEIYYKPQSRDSLNPAMRSPVFTSDSLRTITVLTNMPASSISGHPSKDSMRANFNGLSYILVRN